MVHKTHLNPGNPSIFNQPTQGYRCLDGNRSQNPPSPSPSLQSCSASSRHTIAFSTADGGNPGSEMVSPWLHRVVQNEFIRRQYQLPSEWFGVLLGQGPRNKEQRICSAYVADLIRPNLKLSSGHVARIPFWANLQFIWATYTNYFVHRTFFFGSPLKKNTHHGCRALTSRKVRAR